VNFERHSLLQVIASFSCKRGEDALLLPRRRFRSMFASSPNLIFDTLQNNALDVSMATLDNGHLPSSFAEVEAVS
jgi:hypothetical protein